MFIHTNSEKKFGPKPGNTNTQPVANSQMRTTKQLTIKTAHEQNNKAKTSQNSRAPSSFNMSLNQVFSSVPYSNSRQTAQNNNPNQIFHPKQDLRSLGTEVASPTQSKNKINSKSQPMNHSKQFQPKEPEFVKRLEQYQ